jgi:flagellar basal-body rod protein FlgB
MSIAENKILEKLLSYSALKQKVISQNIANAETKNYKRREVEFKEVLENTMMSADDSKRIKSQYEVKIDENSPVIAHGNNVDVSKEMAEMARNSIMFKFAAKKINGYYQTLQGVIRGGK